VSTLTITRGLPGSGKTHYAKRWVSEYAEGRSRLNRDDLRETMHGGAHGYPRELENAVTVAHHGAVKALLLAASFIQALTCGFDRFMSSVMTSRPASSSAFTAPW